MYIHKLKLNNALSLALIVEGKCVCACMRVSVDKTVNVPLRHTTSVIILLSLPMTPSISGY